MLETRGAAGAAAGSELSGVTKHRAQDGDTQRRAPHWGLQGHPVGDPHLLLVLSLSRFLSGQGTPPSLTAFPNLALGLREPRDSLLQSPHRCRRAAALLGGVGGWLAASGSPPRQGQERSSSRDDHMCPWVLPCGFWGTESPPGEKPGLMAWSGSREPCMSSPVTYRCPRRREAGSVVCGVQGAAGSGQVSPASPSVLGFSSVFPHEGRAWWAGLRGVTRCHTAPLHVQPRRQDRAAHRKGQVRVCPRTAVTWSSLMQPSRAVGFAVRVTAGATAQRVLLRRVL